jgi:uncharacterized protein (TIGR00369 family)
MNVQEQVLQGMHEMAEKFSQAGIRLQMPPATNATLGTRYTDMETGKMLAAEIKFDSKFTNPMGFFQGGFLCAAFDEVCGPLSYMASGNPALTTEMSTRFVRPFTEKDKFVVVRAEVVSQTKSLLVIRAKARNPEGKLIATSTVHALVVTDQNLKREK